LKAQAASGVNRSREEEGSIDPAYARKERLGHLSVCFSEEISLFGQGSELGFRGTAGNEDKKELAREDPEAGRPQESEDNVS